MPESYEQLAMRTEAPITAELLQRLTHEARALHAVIGLTTEVGDVLWYLAILCDFLGTTLADEQARNLAKLRARYHHVFAAEAAQVRDLDRERETADLRQQLDEERSVIADLRQQLVAAQAAVTLQRAGIERLQAFVEKVRSILSSDSPYSNQLLGIEAALNTLDAGTEPTPVAEPLDAEGGQ